MDPYQAQHNDFLMRYFSYSKEPPYLQSLIKPYSEMAHWICDAIPRNPERTMALRKLLESMDCAKRALMAEA